VGFLLLAVGAVVAFGGGVLFQKRHHFVLYFEDPLKGLTVGAPVLWRGVQIGNVTKIAITCDIDDFGIRTPVYIQTFDDRIRGPNGEHDPFRGVSLQTLIDRGLRASLTSQSILTGQKAVTFDLHEGTPVRLVGEEDSVPELPTISIEAGGLLGNVNLEPVMETAQVALQGVAELVRSDDLARSIKALAATLEEFHKLGVTLNQRVGPLIDDINDTSQAARATLHDFKSTSASVREVLADIKLTSGAARRSFDQVGVSAKKIDGSFEAVEIDFTKTLQAWAKAGGTVEVAVGPLTEGVQMTLERARQALDQVRATMRSVGGLTAEDSRTVTNLNMALRAFTDATRAVERLAKTLERQPEALIRGK
jgi:paraquat-inducible protein B